MLLLTLINVATPVFQMKFRRMLVSCPWKHWSHFKMSATLGQRGF